MKNLIVVLALMLLGGFCAGQNSMGGRVLDLDGKPIVGANVVILKTQKGAITDENGRYEIKNIATGIYSARISHVSFRTLIRKIEIPENVSRYVLNVQMIEDPIELDALTIKATRAGEDTPMTFTNLSKAEIEERNLGQDVPYLLRWTPSAVVTSDAGTGIGYTGIRIRGTDPSRINITINGIPMNDSESQGVFWVNLPDFASSTNDIQIQRGVGTSTNGAGAFGASINLNSNKLNREAYGGMSGSLGSFNTWKSNVTFGSGLLNEHFTFDGRLSKIQSDGYIDRGSADLESFYLSGAYLGDKSSLRFNVFSGHEITYQAWNGVPAQYIDDDVLRRTNTAGTEKSGDPYDREVDDYKQTHYQAFYTNQVNRNLSFNIGLHYTKGQGYFEQYKAKEELVAYGIPNILVQETFFLPGIDSSVIEDFVDNDDISVDQSIIVNEMGDSLIRATYSFKESDLIRRRWLDNDFYGTTFSLDYTSDSRKLALIVGGAWNQYDGRHFGEVIWARYAGDSEIRDRYYENDATKKDFNLFGKVNYQLTSVLNGYLDLQFRQVDYTLNGINDNGAQIEIEDQLSFFNPKAGVVYDLNEKTKIYASFAVANREPNRSDYTEANPGTLPKHETLYDTEIGYKQNFDKAAFSANVYYMLYENQLALTGQINDVGEPIRTNIEDSYRLGLELVGGIELAKGLDLNVGATFSQNKIAEFTEYRDNWDTWGQDVILHKNTDLAFSPNLITSGELEYDFLKDKNGKSLKVALLGKYVGKQYIDNTSNENTILDPYFFSDLRLSFNIKTKFVKEIGMIFLVRNLFDNQFSTNAWTYRYESAGYDGRPDDPYTRLESGSTYNLTGFYPQAGRNFLFGLNFKF
jgi:iron complex outermembrane recepter protein